MCMNNDENSVRCSATNIFKKDVIAEKSNDNKESKGKGLWLSTAEAANILGVTERGLQVGCARSVQVGKQYKDFDVKIVPGKFNKDQYLFLLSSLPKEAQMKFYEQKLDSSFSKDVNTIISENSFDEPDLDYDSPEYNNYLYNNTATYNRKKADKYIALIETIDDLKIDGSKKKIRDFIDNVWNSRFPAWASSYESYKKARKVYSDEGIDGLFGKYGKQRGSSSVKDDDFKLFCNLYLQQSMPSLKQCYKLVVGAAKKRDSEFKLEEFPNITAFRRKLHSEYSADSILFMRKGEKAYIRKSAAYVERDWSKVNAGSVWFSDHAQIDVMVRCADGRVRAPWVTVWRDAKSAKWLGWNVHDEAPNSNHIFYAFEDSVDRYGLCDIVYVDNGKDYRAKDLTGGRKSGQTNKTKVLHDETVVRPMMSRLKVKVKFALPYNARAKNIERDFLKNKELFSKFFLTYRGGSVAERPERLQQQINSGNAMHIDEFRELFDRYINNVYNNLPVEGGKVHQGRSPNQVWLDESPNLRTVSREALALFCQRSSKAVKIGKNGIDDSRYKISYWAEWMPSMKGEKVFYRRSPKHMEEIWIFRVDSEEFIGKAMLVGATPAIVQNSVEEKVLQEAIKRVRNDLKTQKIIASSFDTVAPEMVLEYLESYIEIKNSKVDNNFLETKHNVKAVVQTDMDKVFDTAKKDKKIGTQDVSKMAKDLQTTTVKKIFTLLSDKLRDENAEKTVQQ